VPIAERTDMKLRYIAIAAVVIVLLGLAAFWSIRQRYSDSSTTDRSSRSTYEKDSEKTEDLSAPGIDAKGEKIGQGEVEDRKSGLEADKQKNEFPTFEEIKKALDSSVKKSLDGVYFEHQNIMDGKGKVCFYFFTYFIGKGQLPSKEQLNEIIADAFLKRSEGMDIKNRGWELQDAEIMRKGAKLLVESDKALTQEDRFATINVGASYEQPPICLFQKGLPSWVVFQGKAQELARQHLDSKNVKLSATLNHGIGRIMFRFEDETGKQVFVDGEAKRTYEHMTIAKLRANRPRNEEDERQRKERIGAQWNEFLQGETEFQQFDLSKLRDLSKQR
jgi:hypothetical protein